MGGAGRGGARARAARGWRRRAGARRPERGGAVVARREPACRAGRWWTGREHGSGLRAKKEAAAAAAAAETRASAAAEEEARARRYERPRRAQRRQIADPPQRAVSYGYVDDDGAIGAGIGGSPPKVPSERLCASSSGALRAGGAGGGGGRKSPAAPSAPATGTRTCSRPTPSDSRGRSTI